MNDRPKIELTYSGVDEIQQLARDLAAQEAEMIAALKEKLPTIFQQFLADTGIERMVWRQYAPSFNDGDPCTFDRHDAEYFNAVVVLEGEDPDDIDEDENEIYTYKMAKDDPLRLKIEAMDRFMKTIPDPLWEDLYGDGTEVTVTAEGIDTEEYYDC